MYRKLLAAGMAGVFLPVSGLTMADESGFAIEEVLVTARKREESLQDAPLAVTAVSGQALDTRDMTQISAIADLSPNVNFSFGGTSSGSGSAAVVYIRGVGQNDFTPVTDPGVGIYIDGVYLGRTIGSVLDVVDLERLEVLRGPQGTLFGRNSIGGVISLTTRDPGDELAGRIRATVGDDQRLDFYGTLEVPMGANLAGIFTGMRKSRDGYVDRNAGSADDPGDEDVVGFRGKLVWTPSSDLTVKLTADYTREREESAAEVMVDIDEASTFVRLYNANVFGNGAPPECAGGGPLDNPACANDQYNGAPFETSATLSQNDVDQWGVALHVEWTLSDNWSLSSISAYRDMEAEFARDADATPFLIFQTSDDYEQDQFSQEFQLSGTFDRLSLVGGLFYMEEEAANPDLVEAVIAPAFPKYIGTFTDNDNWAVYSELTYDLSERLHLTAGARYTDETKRDDPIAYNVVGFDTVPTLDEVIASGAQPFIPRGERKLKFDKLTWRGSLAYDLADNMRLYGTVSTGFKSGGFDQRHTAPRADPATFEPETMTQYEVGLKSDLLDTLRLNVAAFFSDYEDMQISANPPDEIGTVTVNAAQGEIFGVEAEFTFVPTSEILIEGGLGYMDAEYTELDENLQVEVSKDDEFIRTPEWSWFMGASYRIALSNGGIITPRIDWVYKSEIQYEPVNNDDVAGDSYNRLNVAFAYEPNDNFKFTLGVNNVTDEEYIIAGDSNNQLGYSLVVYDRPRNWYLTAEYTF